MNAKGILEELMKQAGTSQGRGSGAFDTRKLVGSSALGLLIGSRRGRRSSRKALKYGAIAGIGMLAWRAWQSQQGSSESANTAAALDGEPLEQLHGEARERRSLAILQAMSAAARADGHIDDAERVQLTEQIDALGADPRLREWVDEQLQAPLDAGKLAREADSAQAAREMYLASAAIIDEQNPMERAWLDQLAASLGLDVGVVRELESQATPVD